MRPQIFQNFSSSCHVPYLDSAIHLDGHEDLFFKESFKNLEDLLSDKEKIYLFAKVLMHGSLDLYEFFMAFFHKTFFLKEPAKEYDDLEERGAIFSEGRSTQEKTVSSNPSPTHYKISTTPSLEAIFDSLDADNGVRNFKTLGNFIFQKIQNNQGELSCDLVVDLFRLLVLSSAVAPRVLSAHFFQKK